MNLKDVETILEERFSRFEHPREAIYRGKDCYKGQVFAVYLFDVSGGIARSDFDLRLLQESFIRDEYYKVSGSLQWNLYFYLLCEEVDFRNVAESGVTAAVESDRLYARKFVRTIAQLRNELLGLQPRGQTKPALMPPDLASAWVEACNSSPFPFLTSSTLAFDEIARNVEAGVSIPSEQSNSEQSTEPLTRDVISGVSGIRTHGYRPAIDRHEFVFGNVNLISGPNGAGKTSLLEAIELWMCGTSRRNPDAIVNPGVVELVKTGSSTYTKGPVDNLQFYRDRERQWYGTHQKRAITLPWNFSRYNFFDGDAAARLELAPDRLALSTAVQDLVLGEETSRLWRQFAEILDRVKRSCREHEKIRTQNKAQRKRAKDELARLKAPTAELLAAKASLASKLQMGGWLGTASIETSLEVTQLLSELTDAKIELDEMLRRVDWISQLTAGEVDNSLSLLAPVAEKLSRMQRELLHVQAKEAGLRERIKKTQGRLASLKRLAQYYEKEGFQLWNSASRIKVAETHRDTIRRALALCSDLNVDILKGLSGTLQECLNGLEKQVAASRKECSSAAKRLDAAKALFSKIDALAASILAAAREYVDADKAILTCPVCLAQYKRAELLTRVNAVRTNSAAESLRPLEEDLQRANSSFRRHEEQISLLRSLSVAIELVYPEGMVAALGVGSISAELHSWPTKLQKAEQTVSSIVEQDARLNAMGFNSHELRALVASLPGMTESVDLPPRALLNRSLRDAKVELSRVRGELKQLGDEKTGRLGEIEIASTQLAVLGLKPEDAQKRLSQLSDAQSAISRVRSRIQIATGDRVSDVGLRLRTLQELAEAFARLSKENTSIQQAAAHLAAEVAAADSVIKTQASVINRLGQAMSLIEQLQQKDAPTKVLAGFLASTRDEFGRIFRMIHAPKEFDCVEVEEDGGLRARRTGGNRPCPVSELSSGQRSALGLSIFLTMNRIASRAPRIMLMDDPVAHADDLNVLAFLDYLREIALKANRQIFFATASEKVAGLFRKKFDFLGKDNFCVHELCP